MKTHIKGIDSLRFVAALWVAFGHGAFLPVREWAHGGGSVARALSAVSSVVFNGVAAVIVFFIVSGFCIHLPFVQADKMELRKYFLRRYIRIGGPLLVVLLVAHLWSDSAAQAVLAVLWSVYCEIAYYTLYPLLFLLFRAFGIRPILAIASIIAIALICTHWSNGEFWQFGILTFLTAFPAWLLGCLLADQINQIRLPRREIPIIYWRVFAWAYSVVALLMLFHGRFRIGYPATLLVFSFYCYFWLQQELLRWRNAPPPRWLESAGAWSYSIYLVHMIVIAGFREIQLPVPLLLGWAIQLAAILSLSYFFYLIIEWPSHSLARRLGRSRRDKVVLATLPQA